MGQDMEQAIKSQLEQTKKQAYACEKGMLSSGMAPSIFWALHLVIPLPVITSFPPSCRVFHLQDKDMLFLETYFPQNSLCYE